MAVVLIIFIVDIFKMINLQYPLRKTLNLFFLFLVLNALTKFIMPLICLKPKRIFICRH